MKVVTLLFVIAWKWNTLVFKVVDGRNIMGVKNRGSAPVVRFQLMVELIFQWRERTRAFFMRMFIFVL